MATNVYVWGEGQQVDIQQDYSNYSPKNLTPFRGKARPNVIDIAFGWYHEAYLDSAGRLYVCPKPKLPSIKVEEIDDKSREGLVEVSQRIPGKPKIRQASFTRQRMFVLTEKGQVYVFKIVEKRSQEPKDLFDHIKNGASTPTAEIEFDSPMLVKDLPSEVKMIACGSDHFLAMTADGKVFAMGDDTFGQCGQTSEGRSSTAPFFEKRFGKPV
jgi:alpha-tubulin suppressor-like RCC1 family protein